ncbi:DUF4134 family protein [Telluribacter sp.]|jgi:TRAP-type C4-dicarboxylate transport system permease small subunit|uniref:DUF4134 family protein n=1 Tax=Telluribacter sp. TaxID=1978767 RepID=UPI002E146518|nr:DUF4134 family protein [Telluribacter sp.]
MNLLAIVVQVSLYLGSGTGSMNNSLLDRYLTNPISDNLGVLSGFIYTVCAIMSLLGGLKIYTRAMNGEDNVKVLAFRWLGAILAVLIVGMALQNIASSQTPMQGDEHVRNFMSK